MKAFMFKEYSWKKHRKDKTYKGTTKLFDTEEETVAFADKAWEQCNKEDYTTEEPNTFYVAELDLPSYEVCGYGEEWLWATRCVKDYIRP